MNLIKNKCIKMATYHKYREMFPKSKISLLGKGEQFP